MNKNRMVSLVCLIALAICIIVGIRFRKTGRFAKDEKRIRQEELVMSVDLCLHGLKEYDANKQSYLDDRFRRWLCEQVCDNFKSLKKERFVQIDGVEPVIIGSQRQIKQAQIDGYFMLPNDFKHDDDFDFLNLPVKPKQEDIPTKGLVSLEYIDQLTTVAKDHFHSQLPDAKIQDLHCTQHDTGFSSDKRFGVVITYERNDELKKFVAQYTLQDGVIVSQPKHN